MIGRRVIAGMALVATFTACTAKVERLVRPGSAIPAASQTPVRSAVSTFCLWDWGSVAAADDLMRGRYSFQPHPSATLHANLNWREDPFHDEDWVLQLHSLRWADNLLFAWKQTQKRRYLDRYESILRDWLADNGSRASAAQGAWDDHSTAWRAMTFACAYETLHERWIRDALERHGRVLAEPSFYVQHSNHALNQNLGLLATSCALKRDSWGDLAARRIDQLAAESIDAEGITNEQAVGYEIYNYARYTEAVTRLERCHRQVPAGLRRRLALVPGFLAQATMPNGEYEVIGDTGLRNADAISGTVAAFAATHGDIGPKPLAPSAVYAAGYGFGRTGWGETRPFEDEAFYSMRWGHGRAFHGHADGTALTFYGFGTRLLFDGGRYAYGRSRWRDYFRGPAAHNLVTVDGTRFDPSAGSVLVASRSTPQFDSILTRSKAWTGVIIERRMIFSRRLGYMIVEDLVQSNRTVTARQLWHLPPDGNPSISESTIRTRRPRGNVSLTWLGSTPRLTVVRGRSDPIQGWLSTEWRRRVPAPVVEASARGRSIRFITLIVPSAFGATASVRQLQITDRGVDLKVMLGGIEEHVILSGARSHLV